MMELTFPVSPVAASRPRVGRHGSYYTGAYRRFRSEASSIVTDILGIEFEPFSDKLNVDIECYCTRPKTTILDCPKSDVDNIAKAILDILNGKLWDDDNQIVRLYITKQWALEGEPGYFNVAVEKTTVT
jgi:Holliday junction resolvase RusA-like endonuclease